SAAPLEGPVPGGAVQAVLDEATLILPLADVIDVAHERARLARELDKVSADIARMEARLANENFTAKAPVHVVEEQREKKAEAEQVKARLAAALQRLAAA